MLHAFSRTELLLGANALKILEQAHVAVFGIGGVGGFAAEALARAGVGALTLVDHDVVSLTNLNRQIIALQSTIGRSKVELMRERIADINPECRVTAEELFYTPETAGAFDFSAYDYVLDCIDTVTGKLMLVEAAKQTRTPVICAMGAGNKLDPTRFEVADISRTSVCPLAKVMRQELKKRGIKDVKVVYSKEKARVPRADVEVEVTAKRQTPGSISFVPSVMGLIMAGEVIRDLTAEK